MKIDLGFKIKILKTTINKCQIFCYSQLIISLHRNFSFSIEFLPQVTLCDVYLIASGLVLSDSIAAQKI